VDPEPSQPLPGDAAPDDAGPSSPIGLPSWVDEAGWAERFGPLCEEREPEDPMSAFYDDPDAGPPPDSEQESWEVLTARACRDGAEYEGLVARLAAAGVSESAHVKGGGPVPGSPEGPAAGFGQGRPLDAAAPSTVVSGLADEASGEDRAFGDVTDDQLMGLVGARARLVARQHWEELTAVAEFVRRRPHPDADPALASCGMPEAASEDAAADLAALRHLTGILNQYCTFLTCRRPHKTCDYEHSRPFEQGGRTCLCEGGPVCRHHHRDKQAPGWHLEAGENRGWFRWTTASGRRYTTKPTQYPD
jgi:hypothetical protein